MKSENKKPLILVITDIEYKAAKSQFTPTADSRSVGSALVEEGLLGARPIYLCKVPEMGGRAKDSVSYVLGRVIDETDPLSVIELGICFGLKPEVRIGDLCISTFVSDYEYQKINEGDTQYRSRSVEVGSELIGKIENFKKSYDATFKVHLGGYCCGDKVVNSVAFKSSLKQAVPDAKFGDMESYIVARVAESKKIPWLIIKGSSDDGVNKGDEFQELAAVNAVTFFVDFAAGDVDSGGVLGREFDLSGKYSSEDFKNISRELFRESEFKCDRFNTSRMCFDLHHHPQMEGFWAAAYIYKSHSLPEVIKTILKQFDSAPTRLDVCIISRESISELQKRAYEKILQDGGCKKVYLNSIKNFIFEKIVSPRYPKPEVLSGSDYIDQMVYKNGEQPVSGRRYARKFLQSDSVDGGFKPICMIIGQGGVGKTSLCNNIAKKIDDEVSGDRHLLVVTKHDVARASLSSHISSVVDLYRASMASHSLGPSLIDDAGFELAFSCGSIVMVIDGIDEIESVCGGGFNLDGFLESIERLGGLLNSCKVICTSRDSGIDRILSIKNADVVYLKGFDEGDVEKYLAKQDTEVARRIREVKERIKGPEGFTNPYLLTVAKEIFSDALGEGADSEGEETDLDLSDPFEYMLWRVLKREISKQSLGVSVSEYLELIESVVIEQANSMSRDDFDLYVNTMLSKGSSSGDDDLPYNYLKCFLFDAGASRVSVSHNEFVSVVLANVALRVLGQSFLSMSDCLKLRNIFSSDYDEVLGVERDVIRRLSDKGIEKSIVNENLTRLVKALQEEALSAQNVTIRKAIYAVHKFAFHFNAARDQESAAETLKMLHGGNIIRNLYILGDFPLVDFSDLVVVNSEFSNFSKFLMCRFSSHTSFRSCSFVGCSSRYNKNTIIPGIFDATCNFDEAMRSIISSIEERKDERKIRVRGDIKQILKSMRHGLTFSACSMNKIKMMTSLTSEHGYESFLDMMCKSGILLHAPATGLYEIAKGAEADALRLCDEDHVAGVVAAAMAMRDDS